MLTPKTFDDIKDKITKKRGYTPLYTKTKYKNENRINNCK